MTKYLDPSRMAKNRIFLILSPHRPGIKPKRISHALKNSLVLSQQSLALDAVWCLTCLTLVRQRTWARKGAIRHVLCTKITPLENELPKTGVRGHIAHLMVALLKAQVNHLQRLSSFGDTTIPLGARHHVYARRWPS